MSRIEGAPARIDYDDTLRFFERRARSAGSEPGDYLTIASFRDRDTARLRHEEELRQALPLLGFGPSSEVLEAGCGAGRWASTLLQDGPGPVKGYVGVDFSPSAIALARELHPAASAKFFAMSVGGLDEALLAQHAPFSHVIICALLLYVNDDAAAGLFRSVARLTSRGSRVYLREPVCTNERRLTLLNEYSEALGDHYNAIYRTDAEYRALLSADGQFEITASSAMESPLFKSFAETQHRYYLATRK